MKTKYKIRIVEYENGSTLFEVIKLSGEAREEMLGLSIMLALINVCLTLGFILLYGDCVMEPLLIAFGLICNCGLIATMLRWAKRHYRPVGTWLDMEGVKKWINLDVKHEDEEKRKTAVKKKSIIRYP